MHNRMPSRRQGNTVPAQDRTGVQEKAPRMPHERDESADGQRAAEPTGPRMAQAAREDIERGVVDTDKGPVMDETYERVKDAAPGGEGKLSP